MSSQSLTLVDPFADVSPETIEFGAALREGDDPMRDKTQDPFQFRMPNGSTIERTNLTGFDRNEPLVVYGIRDATTHGTNAAGMPCTLIVFKWYLHSRVRGKRFQSVRIGLTFTTTQQQEGSKARNAYFDPAVRGVAPNGTYSLLRAPVNIETKKNAEASLQGGFACISAGSKVGYEITKVVETTNSIIINGMGVFDAHSGSDPDRLNGVEWNLFENESHQTGLPTLFRTAVLL